MVEILVNPYIQKHIYKIQVTHKSTAPIIHTLLWYFFLIFFLSVELCFLLYLRGRAYYFVF